MMCSPTPFSAIEKNPPGGTVVLPNLSQVGKKVPVREVIFAIRVTKVFFFFLFIYFLKKMNNEQRWAEKRIKDNPPAHPQQHAEVLD